MILKHLQEYEELQNWQLKKPATDLAWAEDVKAESLDLKFDKQLTQMKDSLAEKLPRVEKDLDKFNNWEQVVRYELTEQFSQLPFDKNKKCEGKTLQQWIDEEFEDRHLFYTWKVAKIQQSIERIEKEQDLRVRKVVSRKPIGTIYYIDSDNGLDTNAGTHPTTSPWKTLDKFCEAARTAGDKVIVRRGRATAIGNGSDLAFTSDGTIVAPLQIEADYDNVWGDFANSAQTYTTVFGSKTLIASANITGIAAGDWIYVTGDNAREFAYEVASVNGVTLTLYLPFKGTVGSGLTLVVMPDNPIWGTAAGDFQWNFDTDNYWKVQGIEIRGTDVNGQVEIDSSKGHQFKDCVFVGNDVTAYGIVLTDDFFSIKLQKVRTKDEVYAIYLALTDIFGKIEIYDSFIDADANSYPIYATSSLGFVLDLKVYESQIGDVDSYCGIYLQGSAIAMISVKGRNTLFTGSTKEIFHGMSLIDNIYYMEDYSNVVGNSRQFSGLATAGTLDIPIILSNTDTVRAGGGATSLEIRPTANFGTQWDFSRIQLFEIPIYLTAAQKTFTIYFNLPAANFTAAPTATELWIELEAWGHAANNYRKITKSTGTVAKDGNWNALTITVTPAQAGVAYLRCYYCKTKEAESNIFYADPLPVIT